jgi:hypothetical protein
MIEPVPYSIFSLSQLPTLGDQSYKIVNEQHPKNPLLAGVLERLSAFFISEQIRGLDSTLDILNETIARALASARQSASK